jgi:hypothetical protein
MQGRYLLFLLLPVMAACAGNSMIRTGKAGEEVEPDQVRLSFSQREPCAYEVIAHIEITGGYFSRESILQAFRSKAARVGADSVQVHYLQKRDVSEFLGQARAIRCVAPVDVDQSSLELS